ncbi:MAG: CRTAC1 family protein [Akkermansiaceae bacterium]
MPSVREQFKTFHDFASADLASIYGNRLAAAMRLEVNTAETGIFINDGNAHFSFQPLPHLAQVAPTMGAAATHLDGDGVLDLVLAQNDFTPQRETGRMDGGVSFALLGNGDGSFRIMPPATSGIAIEGDVRSLSIFDYLGNNRPDILIARNSASPRLLFNNASGNFLRITLQSSLKRNLSAIGAQITIYRKSGTLEKHQIDAGNGYLSQSPPEIFVSFTKLNPVEKIVIVGPTGIRSESLLPDHLQAGGLWTIRLENQ